MGHAVAKLVETLCYEQEGGEFDSRWGHLIFQIIWAFQPHYGGAKTQRLTEISARNFKARSARNCLENVDPRRLATPLASTACHRLRFTFLLDVSIW
jgi:hypothetical protein